MTNNKETIVLGGGCFWCTEAVFKMLKGVISVEPGYAGGHTKNPTYEEVCSGKTGHAEAIKIEYDPQVISLETLLTVFFATYDPTTLNRQGNDVGEQYRSIILYSTEEQKKISEDFIKELDNSSKEGKSVVTEVKKLEKFYPAEDYHKNYYENHKNQVLLPGYYQSKVKKSSRKICKFIK